MPVTKIVAALVTPPGGLVLVAAFGLGLEAFAARFALPSGLGLAVVLVAIVLLWIAATPAFADLVVAKLSEAPSSALAAESAHAIVVPGRGYSLDADGRAILPTKAWERVLHAARLHRATALPIAVTGGDPAGNGTTEAAVMKRALEEELGVAVRWTEDRARDTHENARLTAALLHLEGVRRVLVVSQGPEMRRARRAFEAAGFEVLRAPVPRGTIGATGIMRLLPAASALDDVSVVSYELIASAYYSLAHRSRR